MIHAFILSLVSFLFISSPITVLANQHDKTDPFGVLKSEGIDGTVKADAHNAVIAMINYFLMFVGLLTVVFLIYAGVLFVTAQGDQKQIEKAKQIIMWSIIGIVIIMFSYVIVSAVTGAVNVVGE